MDYVVLSVAPFTTLRVQNYEQNTTNCNCNLIYKNKGLHHLFSAPPPKPSSPSSRTLPRNAPSVMNCCIFAEHQRTKDRGKRQKTAPEIIFPSIGDLIQREVSFEKLNASAETRQQRRCGDDDRRSTIKLGNGSSDKFNINSNLQLSTG